MNTFGIVGDVLLGAFMPACGVAGHLFSKKVKREVEKAKAARPIYPLHYPDPVAPAPRHVHILDMERSEITVTDAGGVLARCSIAGCGESVYVAPNLAQVYIGEISRARV